MDPVQRKQSSGAALVFVLMGLIALLALAVVFLSRIGREPGGSEPVPTAVASTTTVTEEASPLLTIVKSDDTTGVVETAETPVSSPVIAPPPPPPVSTPDTRNLPPEG